MCATLDGRGRHLGMPTPTVTLAPDWGLIHVALPELGLAMHVLLRAGRAEVTLAGVLVRVLEIGRA